MTVHLLLRTFTMRTLRNLFILSSLYPLVAITQGGAIQLANNGTDGVQGLQTLTMTNAAAAQPGTTILQYAQTSDGQQILVPSNQVVVQGELLYQEHTHKHTHKPGPLTLGSMCFEGMALLGIL